MRAFPRFTKWFHRAHSRSGTLWENRLKSVIVESGTVARTMAVCHEIKLVWGLDLI
jgi:hypothetical protein